MEQFWVLRPPILTDLKQAWWHYRRREKVFQSAGDCPLCSEHVHAERAVPLKVWLRGGKQEDFVWTCYRECLIQPQVVDFLRDLGATGYSLEPVAASHRNPKVKHPVPELWEVRVHGYGGRLRTPALELAECCPACGWERYDAVDGVEGVEVDPSQWDGSDFFHAWPLPVYTLISDRVAKALLRQRFSGFSLACPECLEFGRTRGVGPGSLRMWAFAPSDANP